MIVLWPVYVVFLLLCYLMFFSEYESIRLASFERYTATFLLAWIVSFISLTARLFTEKTNIFVRAVLCAMIISCIIFIPEQFYKDASNITSNDKWIKTRVNVKKFTDDLMPIMKMVIKHISFNSSQGVLRKIYLTIACFHTQQIHGVGL